MICYNLNNRVILQSIYIIIRKSSCFATELYDAKIRIPSQKPLVIHDYILVILKIKILIISGI